MKKLAKGTRLYINLTNKCNVECPFCCMYSGKDKDRFLSFEQFKKIIDDCDTSFELQLEGGEPLLHKDLFLFLEYAIHTGRCAKILVLTNGILLEKYIRRFISIAAWYRILVEFKVSINYYLLEEMGKTGINWLDRLCSLVFATEYMDYIHILFNVRKRKSGDDWMEDELSRYRLKERSNVFYLQSYGKLKESEEYEGPVIVQNIEGWRIYASDGTCFGQDLVARSEYEK